MPLLIDESMIYFDGEGHKVVVPAKDAKPSVFLTVSCDGPRCAALSRNGQISVIAWNEQDAQKDAETLPEEFFKIIKMQPEPLNPEKVLWFCSSVCCRDWLTYSYVRPRTVKELKEAMKVPEKTQEAIASQKQQLDLPFDAPQIESVPDATGVSHA